MTVSVTPRFANFVGSGTTGPFTFNFPILIGNTGTPYITVTKIDAGGTRTVLSYPTDYSFSAVSLGLGGGIVTTTSAIAGDGSRLFIEATTPLDQAVAYRNQGEFFPETHEKSYDKLHYIDQEAAYTIGRSLRIPSTDVVGTSTILPSETARAGKSIKFDANGNVIATLYDPDTLQTAAAASAASAASSASAAATSATNASSSETNAAASESSASSSASSASTSASSASSSASSASTSATNAASSASSASTSATNAATSETNAAASAASAALVDTAGVALLTARVNSVPEMFNTPNVWPDPQFYGLAQSPRGFRGGIYLKATNMTATRGTDSNGKYYINFASSSGKQNMRVDALLSMMNLVAGDVISFSCRITASTVATSGTNNQIRMVQLDSGGSEIAGTETTVNIPASSAMSHDQVLTLGSITLNASAVKLRFDFYAYTSESWRMVDACINKGVSTAYRTPRGLRDDALLSSPALGLPSITAYPNYFNDLAFNTMAAGAGSGSPDIYGAYGTKDANCVATVGTNAYGEKTLTVSSSDGSNTNIYWYQLLSNMGMAIGDTFSFTVQIESRTGTSMNTYLWAVQKEAGGNEPVFRQIQIPNGTITGPVIVANTDIFPYTIVNGTIAVDRLKLGLRVAPGESITISRGMVVKGGNMEYRPFIFDKLYTQAAVDAKITTVNASISSLSASIPGTVNTAVTAAVAAAVTQVTNTNRSLNQFALLGDSRMSHMGSQSSMVTWGFLNHANMTAEMAGRIRVVSNQATSGYRSDQYATQANVDTAIATNAGWLMIWGVVNDIFQGYTASQAWNGVNGSPGLKSVADQARAANMKVIFVTEPGGSGFSSSSPPTGRYQVNLYNQLIRDYCEKNGNAYLFDLNRVVLDPTSTTIATKTNYLGDGTHPQQYGSYEIGKAFRDQFLPLIPEYRAQPTAPWENYAYGLVDLLTNQNFLTTTGGSAGTGISGTVPSGWTAARTGSATATVSTEFNADGFGNNMVVACVFTNTTEIITLTQTLTAANIAVSDILEAGLDVIIDSGSSNFGGVNFQTSVTIDGVATKGNTNNNTENGGPINPNELRQIQRMPRLALPGGTSLTAATVTIRISPQNTLFGSTSSAQVASGTVRICRPFVRKRLS